MLEQLKIENFRCFKSFELNNLGRVNLLVGENNSGKTSILETVKILYLKPNIDVIKEIMFNRAEYFKNGNNFDVAHLFYGRTLSCEKQISILGVDNHAPKKLKSKISIIKPEISKPVHELIRFIDEPYKTQEEIEYLKKIYSLFRKEYLQRNMDHNDSYKLYTISSQGELYDQHEAFDLNKILLSVETNNSTLEIKFLSSSSLSAQESLELFNQIVLTPEEDLVYQALQIIEPNIERIAPITNITKNNNSRSGFFVRLKDTQKRIPIGSMGDGIWRMLGLSLALVSAKDGVLLVDEIDTGLHYTALENMWRLIWETAKKLNVQVFATTHNSDCWKALEVLTSREDVGEEDISIQRIEKDAPRSVAYNKEEIATAVEREIEVR